MAMMKCPECAQPASQKAWTCPHCGRPFRTVFSDWRFGFIMGALICFFFKLSSMNATLQGIASTVISLSLRHH